MVCFVGVDILCDKCVVIVFIYIYGVGCICLVEIFKVMDIDESICVKDFSDDQLIVFCDYIEGNYKVEGDLCCEVVVDICCKVEIGFYEGICYCCGFLVCGQCIKINVCICKGLKCIVVGKKKVC